MQNYPSLPTLPNPAEAALNHSQKLLNHITQKIQENGDMLPFSHYMNLALYAPGLGYYNSGTHKLGRGGDFVTAPEISPLFAKCIAVQCKEVLKELNGGDILEFGAGSGQMAADILLFLSKTNVLPNHYYILEISPFLKARQQEKIKNLCPELINRVGWLEKLPESFTGVILANEVLDAMPVERFKITKQGIQQQNVILSENQNTLNKFLNSIYYPTDCQHLLEFFSSNPLAIGYESEINLNLSPWIQSISDTLQKGIILLIDYGFPRDVYYHPDRSMGTLMCHYQQLAHSDPFLYPGLQDITAHVDFTAIAESAFKAELDILGFTTQASFLLSVGLLNLAQETYSKDEILNFNLNKAIQIFTSPAEMGEIFKVIALGRGVETNLLGFGLSNRVNSL